MGYTTFSDTATSRNHAPNQEASNSMTSRYQGLPVYAMRFTGLPSCTLALKKVSDDTMTLLLGGKAWLKSTP